MRRVLIRVTAVVASLFVAAACTGSAPDEPPPHDHAVVDASTTPLRAGERFVQLSMAQPYTPAVPPGANDEYRCLVIDPELTKPVFLTGVQFQPENPSTAHHAITRSLLDVPAFNFDDQALHVLPAPVALRPGDILRTTCTYDAGLRAQLPQLRDLPPRYVVWGEGTADEMCAPLLTVSAAR